MSATISPVVAITGAGRGIGRAIAHRLAAEGACILVADLDEGAAASATSEIVAAGGQAHAVRADVTRGDEVAHLVETAVSLWGRLDVMVANAGIVQVKPFLEIDVADWDRTFAVNVRGTFLTVQAAARQMLTQEPPATGRPTGKIITMASIAGRYGAGSLAPLIPHYRASKAAVISLTQTAAATFAPAVTVNAICPGLVATGMWDHIDRQWAAHTGRNPGDAWRTRTADVPLGRGQTTQDVAALAEFLASPASDYITGQSINVDGGLTMS